ncbi:MAG TPA: Gfo/Idh/MocA family oxidoreductase [Candidatus Angelobacter sp.]|nr:Gfo/Idh/MocA family oxidoreductase [Candidatus Angelobacter sp.]
MASKKELPKDGRERAKPVRVAVLGTGWIAERVYLPCLLNHGGIAVVAAHDPSPEILARFAQSAGLGPGSLGLPACFDPEIDALLLCTPPDAHAQQIAKSISLDKYVLCEKPVFRDISELDALGPVDAVEKYLMGSASMRLRKDVQLLLRWITEGVLGPLEHVRLGWWRERGVPAAGSWRTDPQQSPMGVMEDLGPHLLDLLAALISCHVWKELRVTTSDLRCVYGHDPRRSASWFKGEPDSSYVVPDQAWASFLSDTGTNVEVEVCWAHHLPGDYCSLEFRGQKGTAVLRGLLGLSTLRRSLEQSCCLKIDGQPEVTHTFSGGPEIQMHAFSDSVDIFNGFTRNTRCPAANYFEIRRVTEWLTDIQDAAGTGTRPAPATTVSATLAIEREMRDEFLEDDPSVVYR